VRFRGHLRVLLPVLAVLLLAVAVAGCGRDAGGSAAASGGTGETTSGEQLSGKIQADGSSTVGPLTTAAAELFREAQPDVNITVGTSGTGGGFERFCVGETDISNASRPIKDDEPSEGPACETNGIAYTEFQVAVDALTVVVNTENEWAECLTVEQLNAIWEPKSEIKNWQDVPGGDYPDQVMSLAGAGTDSGTFDYFTDAINGEEGASRSDYTATEDDNVTVRAVQGDKGALGYFGFSYFEENQDTLKVVAVDGGEGCVEPSAEAAQDGSYTPLSRPLFVYVKNESLAKPEVQEFLRFYFENLSTITEQARFISMPDEQVQEQQDKLETAIDSAAGA
jgi:phosphate transport system substrate-binding protein